MDRMVERRESMRLVITALAAGLVGAVTATLLARAPQTVPAAAPVVDLAPLEAVLRDLENAVRPAAAVIEPARQPVRERVAEPTAGAGGAARADVSASVERVVTALETLAVRLERIASEDQRSAQLVGMVQEMATLPRGVPASWEALAQLSRLGDRASREVAYATPSEIVRRFGSPDSTGIDDEVVWWGWAHADFYVNLRFRGGRVVEVETGRN